MRFSARQQHCLQAMGIVPWVARHVDSAIHTHVTESAGSADVSELRPAAGEPVAGTPPQSAINLGEWVLSRALVPMHSRGSVFSVLGSTEASVLVIVEQAESGPASAALEGDAARLFTLMLRSIQLSARDTRQCIVSREPVSISDVSVAAAACTPLIRAVLVLMDTWPFAPDDTDVEQHHGRLPLGELPLWRIAHPRHLLQQPRLKRQSWQALKSLQAELNKGGSL